MRIASVAYRFFEALRQDLQLAGRSLRRKPLFTAVVLTVLVLGVGASVTVFDLTWALFHQRLPVENPDRLVGVYETRRGGGFLPMSYQNYLDYREGTETIEELAAHYSGSPIQAVSGDRTEMVQGSVVSDNFFELLGVDPALGRFFRAEETATRGKHPVVVLSHRLWRDWFQGQRDVLERSLILNGVSFQIVGVAPEGFRGVSVGTSNDLWISTAMAEVGYRWCDPFSRTCTYLDLLGRLAEGHTIVEAQEEMLVLASGLKTTFPEVNRNKSVAVVPARGIEPGQDRLARLARLLGAVVATVLALVCVNLAGLFLVRNTNRRRELAIRSSLGAGSGRILQQLVTEALVFSLLGTTLALGLAYWLRGSLVPYAGFDPAWLRSSPQLPVVVFSVCLSVLVAVSFGLWPALRVARTDPSVWMGHRGGVGERQGRRSRFLLISIQVAISLALLVVASLLAQSLHTAVEKSSLASDSVLAFRLRPRLLGYEPDRARRFQRKVTRRLRSLPGVEAVGLARGYPFFRGPDISSVHLPGDDAAGGPRLASVGHDAVTPGYFQTVGLRLLRGREFREGDRIGSPPVAIINPTLARRLWGEGEDPVGEILVVDGESLEVIGVVADALPRSVVEPANPKFYRPYWQLEGIVDSRVCVRFEGDAAAHADTVRREISGVDPFVPVSEMGTLKAKLSARFHSVELARDLTGLCAVIGLLLMGVGLYGVLALSVDRRTQEIGIRIAMGASIPAVVGLVVRSALQCVLVGTLLGLPAAFVLSQALSGFLYGVNPLDLWSFGAATLLLTSVTVLAAYSPARRAAAVDPVEVLADE